MLNALNTPWKIQNELKRWLLLPRIWWLCWWVGLRMKTGWRFYGMPIFQIHRQGTLEIGSHLQLRSNMTSNPLVPTHPVLISAREPGSQVKIGDHFSMTGGVIVAAASITIGNYVTVGANTRIMDTDFHPMDAADRRQRSSGGNSAPIVIEDDVFIGTECLILKGVRIGKGSVIGARSVVTHDIPPHSVAVGHPARVIQS